MAKLSSAGGDENLLADGVWVKHEVYGFQFKIRPLPNPEYSRLQSRLLRPHFKKLTKGKVDAETLSEIERRCVAQTVLMDWKDIEDENDEPIAFSTSTALETFETPGLEHLCRWIVEEAEDLENFRAKETEEGKAT